MPSPFALAVPDQGIDRFSSSPTEPLDVLRAAVRALGLGSEEADRAAEDGGCAIDDLLITVAPLPSAPGAAAAPSAGLPMMLTVVMPQRFAEMPSQDASALLANAPGLLAGFDAAIGCLPEGEATLHRRIALPAGDTGGQALAREMVASARLASLVFTPGVVGD
jgi:hypothetical protein